MRAPTGIYIAVIALGIGAATVVTRVVSPNNNFLASLLDVVFVVIGVLALEGWAYRRRRSVAGGEKGTPTFLFTDVEGSTRLLKELGSRYPMVLAEQERLLHDAVTGAGGKVIDSQGDSTFASFATAADAVRAAVAAQSALSFHAWPGKVRMGVHSGAATTVGERRFGPGVHRAARVCALAQGGEILCSQTTHDLVWDEDEDQSGAFRFIDLGERTLEGFERPMRLYRVDAEHPEA